MITITTNRHKKSQSKNKKHYTSQNSYLDKSKAKLEYSSINVDAKIDKILNNKLINKKIPSVNASKTSEYDHQKISKNQLYFLKTVSDDPKKIVNKKISCADPKDKQKNQKRKNSNNKKYQKKRHQYSNIGNINTTHRTSIQSSSQISDHIIKQILAKASKGVNLKQLKLLVKQMVLEEICKLDIPLKINNLQIQKSQQSLPLSKFSYGKQISQIYRLDGQYSRQQQLQSDSYFNSKRQSQKKLVIKQHLKQTPIEPVSKDSGIFRTKKIIQSYLEILDTNLQISNQSPILEKIQSKNEEQNMVDSDMINSCLKQQLRQLFVTNEAQQANKNYLSNNSQKVFEKLAPQIRKMVENKDSKCQQILNYIYNSLNQNDIQLSNNQSDSFNENLPNQINFQFLQKILNQKYRKINNLRNRQLNNLDNKYQNNFISLNQYNSEKEKIEKWLQVQINQIHKIRKNLNQSYQELQNIIDKNNDDQWEKDMLRCLSQKYFKSGGNINQQNNVQSQQQENQLSNVSSIEAIKVAIQKLRDKHVLSCQNQIKIQQQQQSENNSNNNSNINLVNMEKEQICEISSQSQMEKYIQCYKVKAKSDLNSLMQKLKNDNDLKVNLCEFIFLDLTMEIYLELQGKKFVTLMKEKARQIKKQKRRKGFKTDLKAIKLYLTDFHSFFTNQYFQMLDQLQQPLGPSAKQLLKFMRDSNHIEQQQQNNNDTIEQVIKNEIFENFESIYLLNYQFDKYYDNQQFENNRKQFLKNCLFIHHKAIFDDLNQHLDRRRLYGKYGRPFPWNNNIKLKDKQFLTKLEKQTKLKESCSGVYIDCSYMCGILADKEDSLFSGKIISEQYLEHIRQDRSAKMLTNQLIENQYRWIFYDDDLAQVLLEVGKLIQDILIFQCMIQISQIEITI